MAIYRVKDLRSMGTTELKEKLDDLRRELSTEKGSIASGTKAENPGKIRETKRTIARMLTILNERGEVL